MPRQLPDGYRFEHYKGTSDERNDWTEICRHGLIPVNGDDWFKMSIADYPDLNPERDLFFVVSPEGKRVATSASVCHKDGTGYIHMVCSLPECRGLGIGHAMLSYALSDISERGYDGTVILTTDDFRLAAIKTYLDAGFRPVLWYDPESDMKLRWDNVISQLSYQPVKYYSFDE